MKKIIATVLLAAVLAALFSGCSGKAPEAERAGIENVTADKDGFSVQEMPAYGAKYVMVRLRA